jgi:hypothetical protein
MALIEGICMKKLSQKEDALRRQALLESMYSKKDLKEIQEFNQKLAQSYLSSHQLNEAILISKNNTKSESRKGTIGYVYILKNTFMPGLVKIGFTDRDPVTRSRELSSFTGVPGRFEIVISWRVLNAQIIEKQIHVELASLSKGGEFFEIDPNVAQVKVKELLIGWGVVGEDGVSFEERKLLKIEKERRERKKAFQKERESAKNLRHAVHAIYGELMKASLESFRLANEKTKPKGLSSLFNSQDDGLRIKTAIEIFETKKLDLAVRLKMDWVTGNLESLPFQFKDDFHMEIPGGHYGGKYIIPSGTIVTTAKDWVRKKGLLVNISTGERIAYDYWGNGYECNWNENSHTPFYFTVISKGYRVIVGKVADVGNI